MALDAATLAIIAKELETQLIDSKIDKIFEPTRDEVVLQLRTRTGGFKLFVSARSGSARVGITGETFENPAVPPSFCMLMRKHLTGGRLRAIRTLEGERIVYFDFECTNEMADKVIITLAAELMGRYSNIVLVHQTGKIIDALKRVDFEDSDVRQLLPGLSYTLPPKADKPFFFGVDSKELVQRIGGFALPVSDALMKSAGGIGPVICREAAYRAFGTEQVMADTLTPLQSERLQAVLAALGSDYKIGGRATAVINAEGKPTEFSFTALTQYLPGCTLETYPTYSEMLDSYYSKKDAAERLRQKSKELAKTVHNLHERAVRKQAARQTELAQSEASEELRVFGELISANLWLIEKGQKSVTVNNYYTDQNVTIPLDVRIGPAANAQKYFKEYKKKQTAAKMLVQLLSEGAHEIAYLETVIYEVAAAEGENALNDIRAELKAQGYLKYFKMRDKKQKPADFIRYRSSDGFLILVGRNNAQNDKLTIKTARGKDLWFHTQKAPGSHTVVMSEGKDIPNTTKNEAAMIAAVHSSVGSGAKVAVDYTEVRNIRKTNDLKPGMVIYDTYETAYIEPDLELVQGLLIKK
ncbi:MAG: NFACT RNA binding domain-containing protein [Oscillospiraceae bacterium]|nr:NFACT RNA binding domain-containing protein [Oscillospiraceae bacterium]